MKRGQFLKLGAAAIAMTVAGAKTPKVHAEPEPVDLEVNFSVLGGDYDGDTDYQIFKIEGNRMTVDGTPIDNKGTPLVEYYEELLVRQKARKDLGIKRVRQKSPGRVF